MASFARCRSAAVSASGGAGILPTGEVSGSGRGIRACGAGCAFGAGRGATAGIVTTMLRKSSPPRTVYFVVREKFRVSVGLVGSTAS